MRKVKRGQIYYADLSPVVGSEQDGFRPVLILQNDTGNKFSPTTIVAPITSTKPASRMPTHVRVNVVGLVSGSVALLEQIRTIDKRRLDDYVGKLNKEMKDLVRLIKKTSDFRWMFPNSCGICLCCRKANQRAAPAERSKAQ